MKSVIGFVLIAWGLGWCVTDGLTAEALTNVSPPSHLEQALTELSSDAEETREQAIRLLIEQGDVSLLPRVEELRANGDRSLRMALKPVADAWRNRAGLASAEADQRLVRLATRVAVATAAAVDEVDFSIVDI